MKDEIIYELCKHDWETIDEGREFLGRAGNAFTGGADHFKKVWLQKCKLCNKLNRIS